MGFALLDLTGLQSVGSLPPSALVALLPELDETAGLASSRDSGAVPGVLIRWSSLDNVTRGAEVVVIHLDTYTEKDAAIAASVARVLLASPLEELSLRNSGSESSGVIQFDSCASPRLVFPDDETFYASMVAAQVPLPASAGPGWCDRSKP